MGSLGWIPSLHVARDANAHIGLSCGFLCFVFRDSGDVYA